MILQQNSNFFILNVINGIGFHGEHYIKKSIKIYLFYFSVSEGWVIILTVSLKIGIVLK